MLTGSSEGQMMVPLGIGIVLLVIFWAIFVYNRIIKRGNWVTEAWSNVDVQLKLRSDLVPNLVAVVKGYAGHEKAVLARVTELRGQSLTAQTVSDQGRTQGPLGEMLTQLFALAEAYPELKADRRFLDLQEELTAVEDRIQLARRYFNGTVRNFNNAVESFPAALVARAIGVESREFFTLASLDDRDLPEIALEEKNDRPS